MEHPGLQIRILVHLFKSSICFKLKLSSSLQSLENSFSETNLKKLQPVKLMMAAEGFYSSYLVNCVFNAFLCYTTVMLNIVTIHALRKTSSLPQPLKTLLLSLSVSDFGVDLLVQPLYIARLVMEMKQNTETQTLKITRDAFVITGNFLIYASFLGVIALSADRFLAIHYYLRYQELVTHKRVVAVVISVWVFSAILTLIYFRWIPENISVIVAVTIDGLSYITTALFYFKIYLAVRHHRNQIHVLQVELAHNGDVIANAVRQRKSAIGTFYVYLVFLGCYLPSTCIWIVSLASTGRNTVTWHLGLFGNTLQSLNSSLNPLIYCWKMRHIRSAVTEILRNIFPRHN